MAVYGTPGERVVFTGTAAVTLAQRILQQQPSSTPSRQKATKVAKITAIPTPRLNGAKTPLLLLDDCELVAAVVVVETLTMTPTWLGGRFGSVLTLPGATVPGGELAHVSGIAGTTHSPPLQPVLYEGQAEQAAPGMYGCSCP